MGGREADPHLGVEGRDPLQEAGKAQAALLGSVGGAEAAAQAGGGCREELELGGVAIAVHVLAQEGHLLHALQGERGRFAREGSTAAATPPPKCTSSTGQAGPLEAEAGPKRRQQESPRLLFRRETRNTWGGNCGRGAAHAVTDCGPRSIRQKAEREFASPAHNRQARERGNWRPFYLNKRSTADVLAGILTNTCKIPGACPLLYCFRLFLNIAEVWFLRALCALYLLQAALGAYKAGRRDTNFIIK